MTRNGPGPTAGAVSRARVPGRNLTAVIRRRGEPIRHNRGPRASCAIAARFPRSTPGLRTADRPDNPRDDTVIRTPCVAAAQVAGVRRSPKGCCRCGPRGFCGRRGAFPVGTPGCGAPGDRRTLAMPERSARHPDLRPQRGGRRGQGASDGLGDPAGS
ncbi:hypothetical protein ACFPM0_25915 [Pseudonocardia sulfidoxydans]|uniref:hypothetical protein n=1 Tax=Pseudonocardia sulfidoxydans TaxID=54011 RepID=UPI003616905C